MTSGTPRPVLFNKEGTEKQCISCNLFRPLTDFEIQKHKYYRRLCFECKNKITTAHRIKSRFGLSPEQYAALLESQNYKCAICGEAETGQASRIKRTKALAVDHDHLTGKVRGLLCTKCNTGLGSLQDDPGLLWKAAEYLAETR